MVDQGVEPVGPKEYGRAGDVAGSEVVRLFGRPRRTAARPFPAQQYPKLAVWFIAAVVALTAERRALFNALNASTCSEIWDGVRASGQDRAGGGVGVDGIGFRLRLAREWRG